MDKLKVCFVGVGSIAKRHILNLHSICGSSGIALKADAFRRTATVPTGIDAVYTRMEDMPSDYDVIFITNPTEAHLETLQRFHNKGKHFFIEKPVVSVHQIAAAEGFQQRKGSVYYVACPLRYHAVIRYIKENIPPSEVISVRSISSSYLPDWRPGQDYRNTYSAHKDMGGGVSIDLIHEWDYLTYLFGWPKKVYSLIGKKSALEIDSDDQALYIADYADKAVELHLDYFGRKTIREIQLFTRTETIMGDIANCKVRFLVRNTEQTFHEERDDFQKRELLHFFELIEGKTLPEDGLRYGIQVLKLTQGCV